jgi:hypothetical protein
VSSSRDHTELLAALVAEPAKELLSLDHQGAGGYFHRF